ncbi:HNH endonuclease [Algimonas porphyrae]|uniref:HNH endonuclease n=1 Tax=Algimonas porphyrae TaxID=1128113 RepID=UPI0024E06B22|nr:HNH endonuclease [Algimonas porphyrae]
MFIQNPASIYDDEEGAHYHYPKSYHSRVLDRVGDWVILYESGKGGGSNPLTYYAVAEIAGTRPDPKTEGKFYADYVPGSYLDFAHRVPLRRKDGCYHSSLVQKSPGRPNGIVRNAVQPIREEDFWEILRLGTRADAALMLPRQDKLDDPLLEVEDSQTPFEGPRKRERVETYLNRAARDRTFRARVIGAYGGRCALTGLGFVNGGGRAEVQAAHIRPVECGGPDAVVNGLALSGTVHWMFDRGLLALSDDGEILTSRKINDVDSLDRLLFADRKMRFPEKLQDRPHATFLRWHREEVFEK